MAPTSAKVALGALAGCAIGIAIAGSGVVARLGAAETAPANPPDAAAGAVAAAALPEVATAGPGNHSLFARLAEQSAPGVVNVHTSRTLSPSELPFPDLFGPFGPFGPGGPFGQRPGRPSPEPRQFTVPSLGTGFIISPDGYIVTNHHVVAGVDEIEVILSDGRDAEARVVGTDPKTDIALIRVEGLGDLHALTLGDSSAILPGDWVIAIGNPFGLGHTVTVGIVSAKGRDIGQGPYDDFIQTDAAINPGNSGGPLLDLSGAVVGINTAINPQGNAIGFAVPIDLAEGILPQLREKGRVTRGWLGVAIQPITPELAEAFDLERREGALVAQVTPGSPAERAGLRRGDVIVRFGASAVQSPRDLSAVVSSAAVGEKVEVELIRDGARRELMVDIGELEEEEQVQAAARPGPPRGSQAFGLRVEDLTPSLRQRLGVEGEGVAVTDVTPDGAAARAGIRPGDVVVEVDRKPVTRAADLAAALEATGERALLLVRRGEGASYITLDRG
jgi:serine protease Do